MDIYRWWSWLVLWKQNPRVHSSMVRAADCRSAGPWFNSGWMSWFIFMTGSDNLMNHPAQRYNIMSPIRTVITTITRKSVERKSHGCRSLPGCAGQAADVVSACTQVKMEDAPTFFKKKHSQNVQIFGYVYQNTNGKTKSWTRMKDPVVSLESNLYGHPLAGLMGQAICESSFFKKIWLGKGSNLGMFFVTEEKDYSCLCMWTIYKLAR